MNSPALLLASAIVLGVGATLTFDLGGWFMQRALRIPPSNLCLVGRWLKTMPSGIFVHQNIGATPARQAECAVGWAAHYLIGITFAGMFLAWSGSRWLENPTPLPAIAFGAVTVLAPFFIMQPAMGLGVAASHSPNPAQARLRSALNHLAFGLGLYLFGVLLNAWIR